ncbi:hypothetical protein Tco_0471920 [Tanacetum coccineum]
MLPTRRATRTTPATTTTPTTTVTEAQLQALIDQGVAAALAERDASRSRDGDNSHGSGTGGRRQMPTQRECTYTDFLKCQPINFKGTEGVVGLTQWAEKMESVFLISNCAITNQVKFASCTLQGSALTWWNSHVRAVGQDVAYTMPWTALKRMITDKYCPRGEIKKLLHLHLQFYFINGNGGGALWEQTKAVRPVIAILRLWYPLGCSGSRLCISLFVDAMGALDLIEV